LRKWNRLKANHVSRGMVLRIYTFGGGAVTKTAHARPKPKKGTNVAESTGTKN
jgi:hypothetical protein